MISAFKCSFKNIDLVFPRFFYGPRCLSDKTFGEPCSRSQVLKFGFLDSSTLSFSVLPELKHGRVVHSCQEPVERWARLKGHSTIKKHSYRNKTPSKKLLLLPQHLCRETRLETIPNLFLDVDPEIEVPWWVGQMTVTLTRNWGTCKKAKVKLGGFTRQTNTGIWYAPA